MQILQGAGELAGARGQSWRVERTETHGARTTLAHLTRPCGTGARAMVAVRPAEPMAAIGAADRLRPMAVRDAVAAVAHARALERAAFAVPAAERLNGDVHAWQLAAALAFARGHSRVLLADPVGAGKTVSAALAIAECLHGGHERRVLVVAPGHLMGQWLAELALRAGVDARHADAAGLREAQRRLPAGVAPWARPGCTLVSVDFLKQPQVARSLEALAWDLLVIDEAHIVCGLSERHAAADLVARRARRVLLLTATPSDGGDERFRALTALGCADEPLVVLRHTEARPWCSRDRTLHIAPSGEVDSLHRDLSGYAAWLSTSPRAGTPAVGLLASLLVKRALSSAHALRISLTRRLALLGSQPPEAQPSLFDVDDDPGVLGASSGLPLVRERARLEQLIDLAVRAERRDRRLEKLALLLQRTREPVLVFSCFRDTAALLLERLSRVHDARLVHGQLPAAVADAAIAAFTKGPARVLIATDVAAQGLNLHHRCRWVVHYDLPWRPSTIRQRGGRVDRIGQARRPHATMLVDATPLARQMLERTRLLTMRMEADQRESAARWRVLAAHEADRVRARRAGSTASPAAHLAPGTTHVIEIELADRSGATVERSLFAAHGEHADVIAEAESVAVRRAAALRRGLAVRASRQASRERAVAAATLETVASTVVQGGLFDRRAVRQREARDEAREMAARALSSATARFDSAARIHTARVRPIAAFTRFIRADED